MPPDATKFLTERAVRPWISVPARSVTGFLSSQGRRRDIRMTHQFARAWRQVPQDLADGARIQKTCPAKALEVSRERSPLAPASFLKFLA